MNISLVCVSSLVFCELSVLGVFQLPSVFCTTSQIFQDDDLLHAFPYCLYSLRCRSQQSGGILFSVCLSSFLLSHFLTTKCFHTLDLKPAKVSATSKQSLWDKHWSDIFAARSEQADDWHNCFCSQSMKNGSVHQHH